MPRCIGGQKLGLEASLENAVYSAGEVFKVKFELYNHSKDHALFYCHLHQVLFIAILI